MFRQIKTGSGTVFFGPMWKDEAAFIKECKNRKIKIICNLCEESHGNIDNAIEMWFPIKNYHNPDIQEDFDKYIQSVVSEIKSGKNVFVHCLFGIGRTSFALKAIMAEFGFTKEECISIVNEAYANGSTQIPETKSVWDKMAAFWQ